MLMEELGQWGTQAGLRRCENNLVGQMGGYPLRICLGAPKKSPQVIGVFSLDMAGRKDQAKTVGKALKAVLKGRCVLLVEERWLTITMVKMKTAADLDRLDSVLRDVLEQLQGLGVAPAAQCPICGRGNCDALALMDKGYVPLHGACLKEQLENAGHLAEKNDLQGNYFIGLLGGLVGAMVGAIPSILSAWFADTIYALLYALIPLASYYGYKLCRGKLNRVGVAIICLESLIGSLFVNLALVYIILYTEVGQLFNPLLLLVLLTDPEFWGSSLDSILFVGLGIWIAWRRISRSGDAPFKDLSKVQESMVFTGAARQEYREETQPAGVAQEIPVADGPEETPGEERV